MKACRHVKQGQFVTIFFDGPFMTLSLVAGIFLNKCPLCLTTQPTGWICIDLTDNLFVLLALVTQLFTQTTWDKHTL